MHKRHLWYTRRDGVIRGPYPEKQITRYILLGRIRDGDDVRRDDAHWAPLGEHPDLLPEVMKLPPTEENLQKLAMARLREDERRPRDRRDDEADVPAHILERRSGQERRRPEADDMQRHRALRDDIVHTRRGAGNPYRFPLGMLALVLLGLGAGYLMGRDAPAPSPPECNAPARPGINWNGCDLAGLDSRQADLTGAQLRNTRLEDADLRNAKLAGVNLEYATLSGGDFRAADLTQARLVGITARGADLRDVRFAGADLSYANLSGARLEGADLSGADLSHAIWVDRHPCLAGSVGGCVRASR